LTFISNEEDFISDFFKITLTNSYKYQKFLKYIKPTKLSKLSTKFSVTNISNAFSILYFPEQPIDFIFSVNVIEKYDRIYKFIFQYKTFSLVSSKIFSIMKNEKSNFNTKAFLRINILINDSINLIKTIGTFLFNEILQYEWNKILNILNDDSDIYEFLSAQNQFLDNIIHVISLPVINLVYKLQLKLCQFYLKSCLFDIFDYENCIKDDDFQRLRDKIEKNTSKLKNVILNDSIIGEFHNLKYYINYI
jgi:hypothetical protein